MAFIEHNRGLRHQFTNAGARRAALEQAGDAIVKALPDAANRFAAITKASSTAKSDDLRDAWDAIGDGASKGHIHVFDGSGENEVNARLWFDEAFENGVVQGYVRGADKAQVDELAAALEAIFAEHAA
ncbi:hypothetical protein [Curtobacterium sp. MCBD17_040]|uniref:hypothetical protein n=1 Tax=Curtobacterium sp. MCBD17_040 TaxID=2175674 RepID=UPI000DAACBC3|nr:hypothetical protein [Curtobacterium sp. MCBD17_040]WIB65423.1 hypothetical protein DEI94_18630 [Curtobacterium sp. MCBD17_040]